MSRSRRNFGNEMKAQVVRRHWADKVPVSQLAEEFGVQPSQIHTWVNLVLAQAEQAFERSAGHGNGRGEKALLKSAGSSIAKVREFEEYASEVDAGG